MIATIAGPPAGRAERAARPAASSIASASDERARRARHEVQPDRVGAGANRGEDPVLVGDAADLDERHRRRGSPDRRARGRRRRTRGRRRAGSAARISASPTSAASNPTARQRGDGRGVADAGLGDDEPVVRDELAEPDGTLRVDVERSQVAVVQADEPRVRRERALELALVVGLDERLQAELERPLDEPSEPLGRVEHGEQQDEVRAGGAEQVGSWRGSTTNSLARTGIETAARTARRSSTEPPNQCGSHSTEIAAAPPAS